MWLLAILKTDFKEAMKAREVSKKEILSYVIAQINAKEKDLQDDLSDDDIIQLMKKEIKMRKETIVMLESVDKQDDAAEEQSKMDVLMTYLPAMMSKEDLATLVEKLTNDLWIEDLNKERGKLIWAIMKDYRAEVDGGLMNEVINEKIKTDRAE